MTVLIGTISNGYGNNKDGKNAGGAKSTPTVEKPKKKSTKKDK